MIRNPYEADDEPDDTCVDCGEDGWKEIQRIGRSGAREWVWVCSSCYERSALDDDGDVETAEPVDYERDGNEAA